MIYILINIVLCGTVIVSGQDNTSPTIPDYLVECYSNPYLYNRQYRLPATMDTLIELIRKVELNGGILLDINTLTYNLIHRFQMDGIEYRPGVVPQPGVTPFSPSGRQFPKHQILLRSLIPGNGRLFPNSSLTAAEKCSLHFMLSTCVDPWERGDEHNVCPTSPIMPVDGSIEGSNILRPQSQQRGVISRCPIEDGVVLLKQGGTINVGRLLAGISTALQSEEVQLTRLIQDTIGFSSQFNTTGRDVNRDSEVTNKASEMFEKYQYVNISGTVRNTWASTLAGDLAEMTVYQGPFTSSSTFVMGPAASWNDTAIPRIQYLNQSNNGLWDVTDAELQGSIDGLILGNRISEFVNKMGRLRLSQVLDMYYSSRGINFDPVISICNRTVNFRRMTDSNTLFKETNAFARALSFISRGPQISDETLQQFTERTMQTYQSYLQIVLNNFRCDYSSQQVNPQVHLNLILDNTWIYYEGMRFLSSLAQAIDVSHYGSSISALNGYNGAWILNATNNITQMFTNNITTNASTLWPNALALPLSLEAVRSRLAEKADNLQRDNTIGDSGDVVLVVAYSSTISDADLEHAKQIIQHYKQFLPDVTFFYVTSNINVGRFRQLVELDKTGEDSLIVINNNQIDIAVMQIANSLRQVPGRLIGQYCVVNGTSPPRPEHEEYITPGETRVLRIHPDYLVNVQSLSLEFHSNDYGRLTVCLSRNKNRTDTINCTSVSGQSPTNLTVRRLCDSSSECRPLFLLIDAVSTQTRCTEDDCRYPDQVRLLIRHTGLRCTDNGHPGDIGSILSGSKYIFIFVLIIYLIS